MQGGYTPQPDSLLAFGYSASFLPNQGQSDAVLTQKQVSTDTLDAWLDKLMGAESSKDEKYINCTNATKCRIVDTNSQFSTGCLMYQLPTWLEFGKKYGFKTTPQNIADCSLQRDVTYAAIKADWNNWTHWRCSVEGRDSKYEACQKLNKDGIGKPPKS